MFSSINSRKARNFSILAIVCLLTVSAFAQKPADNPLAHIPADSLFCARINNFDNAMGLIDTYLDGLPLGSVKPGMMARMPLAHLVADPMLKNIRFDGDFAVFALHCGSGADDANKNVLVGVLLPVTDYDTFLREHPNASAPDDNGISRLAPAEGKAKTIVRKLGSYGLFTHASNYDRMVSASRLLSERKAKTIADVLDRRRARAAAGTPIWAYANIQRIGEVFGPTIFAGLDKAKVELEKMSAENKGMTAPGNVMDIYVQFFKEFFSEVDSVTWAVTPAAEVCRISTDLTPVEGKDLARILDSSSPPRGANPLLSYLDNGAMVNIGMKNDRPLIKQFYDDMFSILGAVSGEAVKPGDIDKFKKLTNESFDAFGDALAFSMAAAPDAQPPFAMKYFVQIKDVEAYNRILKEEIELINAGAMNDLYKGMGLEMEFSVTRNTARYKGVRIDSATLNFKSTEAESDMDKAIRAMYGDGFEYRWAIVDNLMVYAVSGDVDKDIRALIDEAKSSRPRQLPKEMAEALSHLPRAASAQAVGTCNLVRLMQMGMGMTKEMTGDASVPKIDVATESNVAFAVRVRNGRIIGDYALPKKHLMEMKAAVEQLSGQKKNAAPTAAPPASESPKL